MPKDKVPIYDLPFWWLRHGLGIALPITFIVWGVYSIVTLHSYAISWSRYYRIYVLPVEGKQAVLMGVACLGIALMLFANCYSQYLEKMGFYYQWLLAAGALLAGGCLLLCSWGFQIY